jgi:hypothetical protein
MINLYPQVSLVRVKIDSYQRIKIQFNKDYKSTILKSAILKLACDYNIDVHRALTSHNLAPKVLGHENLCDNYHIIVMEYLDNCAYRNIFDFVNIEDNSGIEINHKRLYKSLIGIMEKLKLNIVHCNILAKNLK